LPRSGVAQAVTLATGLPRRSAAVRATSRSCADHAAWDRSRLIAWIDLPVGGERSAGAVGLVPSRQRRHLPAEVSGMAWDPRAHVGWAGL